MRTRFSTSVMVPLNLDPDSRSIIECIQVRKSVSACNIGCHDNREQAVVLLVNILAPGPWAEVGEKKAPDDLAAFEYFRTGLSMDREPVWLSLQTIYAVCDNLDNSKYEGPINKPPGTWGP